MELDRRFGGVARLYGEVAVGLARHHVCVVGIGGVGSWTVEALIRSGIGRLTAVDLDVIAESNTNRQIHALEGNFGKAKVEAMRERALAINPHCDFQAIDEFVTPENIDRLLSDEFDILIDATDQMRAKVAMVNFARKRHRPVIVIGAAGGKRDPTSIRKDDLARTTQDPLLAKLRATLRRHHGFMRDPKKKMGVTTIYSLEPVRYPAASLACEAGTAPQGLNCAGFGSSVCVTSTFGMAAAAETIALLTKTA